MAQLVNLSVNAVAFVQRGANRKKFFLTKSAGNNQSEGVRKTMHEVIRKALQLLMKSEDHKDSSVDDLIKALKGSEVIKKLDLSDEDFVEVRKDIELVKSLSAPVETPAPTTETSTDPPTPIEKKDQIITDLQKSVSDLTKTLTEQQESMRLDVIKTSLKKRAPFAPIDVEKEAKLLLKLEKVDKDAADRLIESFEQSSKVLASSDIYQGSRFCS